MSSYYGPSSDHSQSRRKRSRWGGDDSDERRHQESARRLAAAADAAASSSSSTGSRNRVPGDVVISDQDAVQALLSSAQARQQEETKQQQEQQHRLNKKPRGSSSRKQQEKDDVDNNNEKVPPSEKEEEQQQANFGLSGALAKDQIVGNTYKGVVLKFSEPPEARAPNTQWRLYVFKNDEHLETLHIAKQSAYLFGRNADIADVPLQHPSLSSQHAVIQYRALPNDETGRLHCQPYLMDLESTNGTYLNGVKIDSARYYQLKKGDVIKFGASTREYVLMTANTKSI